MFHKMSACLLDDFFREEIKKKGADPSCRYDTLHQKKNSRYRILFTPQWRHSPEIFFCLFLLFWVFHRSKFRCKTRKKKDKKCLIKTCKFIQRCSTFTILLLSPWQRRVHGSVKCTNSRTQRENREPPFLRDMSNKTKKGFPLG